MTTCAVVAGGCAPRREAGDQRYRDTVQRSRNPVQALPPRPPGRPVLGDLLAVLGAGPDAAGTGARKGPA